MTASKTDSKSFRTFMRNVPSAVTIVTAAGDAGLRGMTAGSFVSVSLDPPLVCFNVGRGSKMSDVLHDSDAFAVHLLRAEQSALAEHFAAPDLTENEQFDPVAVRYAENGVPILVDAPGVLLCSLQIMMQAGDHDIVIGRVEEILSDSTDLPLLYYQRSYRTVADHEEEPGR
jgi:flavin reductase (DIM6/NTAB) family NADH-FMN oxidoreductase RutF